MKFSRIFEPAVVLMPFVQSISFMPKGTPANTPMSSPCAIRTSKASASFKAFSLTLVKAFTRFEDVRRDISKGKDPRGTIITKLKDPDATGGQTERYQIGNVAFSEFGLEWEKGAVVKQEYPFAFTPSDMVLLDEISEQ